MSEEDEDNPGFSPAGGFRITHLSHQPGNAADTSPEGSSVQSSAVKRRVVISCDSSNSEIDAHSGTNASYYENRGMVNTLVENGNICGEEVESNNTYSSEPVLNIALSSTLECQTGSPQFHVPQSQQTLAQFESPQPHQTVLETQTTQPQETPPETNTSQLEQNVRLSVFSSKAVKNSSILEKEKQMKFLLEIFPNLEAMKIHGILCKHSFNTDAAAAELSRSYSKAMLFGTYTEWKDDYDQRLEEPKSNTKSNILYHQKQSFKRTASGESSVVKRKKVKKRLHKLTFTSFSKM